VLRLPCVRRWLAAVLCCLSLSACQSRSRLPRVGSAAPTFSVENVRLSQFRGQVIVLNFWATWCSPCVQEIPSLVEMQRRMKAKGVTVIAVSVDVDENAYRQFIKNHNVNLLTVRDPSGKTNAAYGTFKFPESYIIDRKGIIQHKFLGAVDWTDQQVIDLLNGLSSQNGAEQLRKAEADNSMSPKIVEQPEFMVAGIAARTSNTKEMTADGVIGNQWARLMQEDILAKIPNRADAAIVAVYTDYASDKDGEYTYLLGARVTSNVGLPAGVVAKKIPAGKFAVFTTGKGPGPKVVPETWIRINSLLKSAAGGDRVYRADYEIYDERAKDPQNLQADLYVEIR
jgi:cytochrome c biogenesis protein CcmG, thiol:disulfide interchange protein DsbE